MNSSLYNCHTCNNDSNTSSSSISENLCATNCNYNCTNKNIDTSSLILKSLENDLCDMKITLAETKTTLIFLAQTLCNQGNLCCIEKTLLLNIEQSLKSLNCKINDSRCNVDKLNTLI